MMVYSSMAKDQGSVSDRKKDHINLCLTEEVAFQTKTNGFEHYDFVHYAITEVDTAKIDFKTDFFGKNVNYPFLISCMTGGTEKANDINLKLAVIAEELQIPVGMGSQRQALENENFHSSYKIIRRHARSVPVLGNIGAAQVVQLGTDKIRFLVDLVEADAMIIHINPLQELIQDNGEPLFSGLLNKIEQLTKELSIPVIIKEVGSGISGTAARKLLECGVRGIDVAGAGGTSWAGVEMLRNNNFDENFFWDWGLPTSWCIKDVYKLKTNYEFTIIGSGGINNSLDMAKAFALGADIAASARIILQELEKNGAEAVINMIHNWFNTLRKIMYLTGSASLPEFKKNKIILKEYLY
jgi:isopentenyl-diphosphate Delta-isomerase